jgi:hypothetical protein
MEETGDLFELIVEDYFSQPKKPIFHYTNQIGYDAMWRSNRLILNPHQFLNKKDPSNYELQTAYVLIIEKMNKWDNDAVKVIFDKFIDQGIIFYSASFSNERSLHLAKKYGAFCFEFRDRIFRNFIKKERSTLFANVIYDEDIQQKLINEIFSTFEKRYNELNEEREDLIDSFILSLIKILPLLKTRSNRGDNECRIVQVEGFDPKSGMRITPFISKQVKFDLKNIRIFKIWK